MARENDPSPLQGLLGMTMEDCPCGRPHIVPTLLADLRQDALSSLPEICETYCPRGRLLFVVDENTWRVAGEKAVSLVSASDRETDIFYLDKMAKPAHADMESVEAVASVVTRNRVAAVIAVGSGTINDVCKSASTRTDVQLITVATAASMNGYPSAISALTVDGVKITAPCKPPVAIIADPEILSSAPHEMTGAGFGDLLSKNASTADWRLSNILFNEYYCDFSATLAETAVKQCIANADEIRSNTPKGLSILAEALIRSGISMVIAGSSSPASGGEHLMSHLWDMTAHWSGRAPALHGQQTGITTLISLRLYEKLITLEKEDLRDLFSRRSPRQGISDEEQELHNVFGDLAEAILPTARKKLLDTGMLEERQQLILKRWDDVRRSVSEIIIPAEVSRKHLEAAGTVFRADQIGISRKDTEFAYQYARFIRDRYSVLDLAADLGVLEQWREEIIETV